MVGVVVRLDQSPTPAAGESTLNKDKLRESYRYGMQKPEQLCSGTYWLVTKWVLMLRSRPTNQGSV